jgi:hypothetical protein
MKHTLVNIILLVITATSIRAEELKLKNGKVFVNIMAVTDGGDKVKITHDSGIASIPKRDIPQDFLTKHEIPLSTEPLKPTTPAPSNGNSGPTGKEREERALTASSIVAQKAYAVELTISNYENETFIGQAVVIETLTLQKNVVTGFDRLSQRDIVEKKVFNTPKRWHLLEPLRVYGLPKSVATGSQVWQGHLWLAWSRDGAREAFTSREYAMKYLIEKGVGKKPSPIEYEEQTDDYLRQHGMWRGPATLRPKPSL